MDLFKSFKHEASPSRSGFDLSRRHVFSSKVGQAIPCLSVETVPGDHFEIDLASLTRTETFDTAAFLRGKQRFDFFFVPNTQAWHLFNQFITQRSDKKSSAYKGSLYAPVMNLADILIWAWHDINSQSYEDIHGYFIGYEIIRLLDMLGYGNHQWVEDCVDLNEVTQRARVFEDNYVNLFRLAAYQHIWYDFYRNKYWDTDDTGGLIPERNRPETTTFSAYLSSFNFDDMPCNTFANSVVRVPQYGDEGEDPADVARFVNLFSLRYVQWKKDLFTSSLPGQQFGAISSVDLSVSNPSFTPSSTGLDTGDRHVLATNSSNSIAAFSVQSINTGESGTWNFPSAFDVLSLRKAEALQQWKQNVLRGGNSVDEAFKSHFGVSPYYENDDEVHFLGSFSSALQVNPVESTAASTVANTNNRVGDLAATGTIVANGSKIKFDAKDYGVIMCIASFLPESEYASSGIDKANTLHEQFDFFTPEFQNIGLEAVERYQQDIARTSSDSMHQIIGYAPRYYMYKCAIDKVFGEFADSTSPLAYDLNTYTRHDGSLQPWVSPRYDTFMGSLNENERRTLASLYVTPAVYNNVSAITADDHQSTDFFVHNVFFDIKAIRPMTVLGLPQF